MAPRIPLSPGAALAAQGAAAKEARSTAFRALLGREAEASTTTLERAPTGLAATTTTARASESLYLWSFEQEALGARSAGLEMASETRVAIERRESVLASIVASAPPAPTSSAMLPMLMGLGAPPREGPGAGLLAACGERRSREDLELEAIVAPRGAPARTTPALGLGALLPDPGGLYDLDEDPPSPWGALLTPPPPRRR